MTVLDPRISEFETQEQADIRVADRPQGACCSTKE